uniref:Uncharacterized protein LOC111104773 n=1 Tax=Crassostrea virginica TaxID=6565 RepID=A0A8B8AV81_CRAVI|nr:uncharacterized protein LOC111104773 [Crassostrea virginica]XP_022294598.1 uncharacterized protein LOC111104773 [Crassostrea virginica]XP_022294600.1 uncharacterized protein LOC111104773 [Crassostrea virginica]XP_022294601.1 uncharacterized protein LOC111104773 [Crassostrea virginica]
MNVTNDIIARHFQDVNIYEVTKLQSNTKYQFRVVTFDCDDVVISSGHLTCHTRPVIDKRQAEECNKGSIIGVSLGGAVLFVFCALVGGFTLINCYQKRQQIKSKDHQNCKYVDQVYVTNLNDHQYEECSNSPNTASERTYETAEYLEIPDSDLSKRTPERSLNSI